MTQDGERGRRAARVMVGIVLLALTACGGKSNQGAALPPSTTGSPAATSGTAPASTARPTSGVPATVPCPIGTITVSPLGEWRITGRSANLTNRPEDEAVVWQTSGAVANSSAQRIEVKSIVVLNVARPDASSFRVRSVLDPAAERNEIGLSTGDIDVVRPGEALSMLVVARTRAGWPVSTSDMYVQATFEDRKECPVSVVGAKDYASAPTGLYFCGKNANSQCFR